MSSTQEQKFKKNLKMPFFIGLDGCCGLTRLASNQDNGELSWVENKAQGTKHEKACIGKRMRKQRIRRNEQEVCDCTKDVKSSLCIQTFSNGAHSLQHTWTQMIKADLGGK